MDEITKAVTEAFPHNTDFIILTRSDFDLIKSHIQPSAIEYYRLDEIQMLPLVLDVPEDGAID